MTDPRGLSRIALPALEQLLAAVERGRLECPFEEADLADVGFKGLAGDLVQALRGGDRVGVVMALRVAIAERRHRPPPRLDLVWTGPETRASTARDTSLVVQRLFESAQRSVIVGGYAFDRAEMLRPLHVAMVARGISATFFVDIEGATARPEDADRFATAFIDKFFRKIWTFGTPKPDIFYDPRTAIRGDVAGHDWATLHAKCIVVDDERSLITSANFTDRGHTRNIEAGVLIEDPVFSEELAGHWRQLVSEGLVRRYSG
jgi:phosphatidylserine/phosphatidylglycerophosphate/cardiolipin synthase-like enzyme